MFSGDTVTIHHSRHHKATQNVLYSDEISVVTIFLEKKWYLYRISEKISRNKTRLRKLD